MATTIWRPVKPTKTLARRPRVIHGREAQSVMQIKDRVWQAKIHKVERIEEEEDYMWGVIADRVRNDPTEYSVPLDVVQRELGLERPRVGSDRPE